MLKYALQGKMAAEVERLYGKVASNGTSESANADSQQHTQNGVKNGASHENGAVVGTHA
jgi:hypothetical protein